MSKIFSKLLVLSILVLFTQCSKMGFIERRYNKGHYHENNKHVATKNNSSKKEKIELPDVKVKTEVSEESIEPIAENKKEEVTASTEKKATVKTNKNKFINKFNLADKISKKDFDERKAKVIAKMPFSAKLLKRKAEAQESGGSNVVTMILSIVGFAGSIVALVLSIYSIIDTFIGLLSYDFYLSPYFFVAIALGAVAIACGITTLIMGKGDLESFQRSFAILAIILGAVAIIVAGIWLMVFSAIQG